ncbi:CpsD/CapB family tyrosine-protein kinase [Enterococcus sp. HY326]|uniref:CpsD/CapB family tyrosine-protein kinase n=1 Tax=Enterococcus sp. HY326 TaxID=2971265 RepID=UPI00223F79B4|nr:CpsD/CapB family tyrosine-protein kinase [Enterococcus sp. HY326]
MAKKHNKEQETSAVSLISMVDQSSPITEQYRTIRTNIQFSSSADKRIKTIVITSSGPGEGKSTTSANLAVVFANSGQRTLLVDADMRKPTVHKSFGLTNNRGLSTILSTETQVGDVVNATHVPNLFVVTSGIKPPNPSELLGSVRFDVVMDELSRLYDIIIFDMPPVVTVTDAQIVSSKADGTILVVREDVTRKDAVMKAKELLELTKAHVLGVVYNGSKDASDKGYYYYYGN